jgi:flagellar biosynthesis/type III secretory pathway ATPase
LEGVAVMTGLQLKEGGRRNKQALQHNNTRSHHTRSLVVYCTVTTPPLLRMQTRDTSLGG